MKALSMTQPWASLFLTPAKQWETRSRRILFRGWLAIHAAKGMPVEAKCLCGRFCAREPLREYFGTAAPEKLVRGSVIGLVQITGCVEAERLSQPQGAVLPHGPYESLLGDFTPGRFAWQRASNVYRLREPVPCNGALGLWDLPEAVEAQVRQQVRNVWADPAN